MIGQVIGGYEIIEVLGRGGMGVVFKAVDKSLEKTVALKALYPVQAQDEPFLAAAGDEKEALHWLRKAIFLGNEKYPWLAQNPTWTPLNDHADYVALLVELEWTYAQNRALWKRTLAVNAEA